MADNFNTRLYARANQVSARAPSTSAQQNSCLPACVCGQLECLCRPRFFAGQLLTEQDLNRLDAYIRAKNRLHNLQLHGWGVVNGLIVRCDPCGNGVTVGTGYAISPCGEDIIVCSDTSVDVCSLIKKCTPPDVSCQPSAAGVNSGCDELVEDWVLAIRYSETQTRGVAALRMGSTCSCGATGGTCSSTPSSGCGCGGATAKTTSTAPTNSTGSTSSKKPRGASAECEPTAICESYSFDVFRAPASFTRDQPQQLGGALVQSFECCVQALQSALPPMPPMPFDQNKVAWNLWCCRAKAALIGYFSTGSQWDCTLVTQLQSMACPSVNSNTFAADMNAVLSTLGSLLIDALIACLCTALLPPPPAGTSDDRVPLAVISVRKKDCSVQSVCNWTSLRKTVITFPTLEYWLSWIPWLSSLPDMIGAMCCRDFTATVVALPGATVPGDDQAMLAANPALDAQQVKDNQTLMTLVKSAFDRKDAPIDPAAMVSAFFGVGQSAQNLSATEQANPAPFLLLNEVLRPIVNSITATPSGGTATPVNTDTAALMQRVTLLEAQVQKLQKA